MDFARSGDVYDWVDVETIAWPDVCDLLFGTCLPAAWEIMVAGYLFWRGFAIETIRTILEHARAFGSVECFDAIPLPILDRQAIEAFLPEATDESWAAYAGIWEINEP